MSVTVNGSHEKKIDCDAVVVGAGFSGVSSLHKLRKMGLKVKVFEDGDDFGGVWYWNRYPGARVDSETPFYQLNIPEVWSTWTWSCRYPDHQEIRNYFEHVDKILGLRKDVEFNARVVDAQYNVDKARWTVKTNAGHVATCKYLILASGLLHTRYYPDFPGLNNYKGVLHHSAFWPEDTSVKGKKVAVIGAGATSVQVVQELSKEVDHLTMFMRRPSYCLPMQQRTISEEEQVASRAYYDKLFEAGRKSRAGFPTVGPVCKLFDVAPEEREAHFEEMWRRGAFNFNICTYTDVLLDKKANRVVYDFWAKKVRARMSDPVKQDLMAPLEPPYWFGTKRCPLENDYYESLDRENVEIVDLNAKPLKSFTETGILTEDGKNREFDVVVLATGFDSFTGSVSNMGLKNKDGVDMKEVWKDGVMTYLGMMCHGFPNAFMIYTPQAPTALSNGPTILEAQLDFICEVISQLESQHAKSIEPTVQAQIEWKDVIAKMNENTLFPLTKSWWTGGNIPGKKNESLTFTAGIDEYERICRERVSNGGWRGFDVLV